MSTGGLSDGVKVTPSGGEVDYATPFSEDIKNEWIHISIPQFYLNCVTKDNFSTHHYCSITGFRSVHQTNDKVLSLDEVTTVSFQTASNSALNNNYTIIDVTRSEIIAHS